VLRITIDHVETHAIATTDWAKFGVVTFSFAKSEHIGFSAPVDIRVDHLDVTFDIHAPPLDIHTDITDIITDPFYNERVESAFSIFVHDKYVQDIHERGFEYVYVAHNQPTIKDLPPTIMGAPKRKEAEIWVAVVGLKNECKLLSVDAGV